MNKLASDNPSPGFLEGVAVALIASVLLSTGVTLFESILPLSLLARVLISMAGLGYLLYLFSRCHQKVGRMSALSVYAAMVMVSWLLMPPLPWVVIVHLVLIWLIRSLYFYSSVLSALLDLGLMAVSLLCAMGAYLYSGSLFLGLWCLFLIQAMFSWIPPNWRTPSKRPQPGVENERFDIAYLTAQRAVRKLAITTKH